MSDKDNGGSAFPQGKWAGEVGVSEGGMTLRDWFAGQALVRVMMMQRPDHYGTSDYLANQAYEIADAMLAARAAQ